MRLPSIHARRIAGAVTLVVVPACLAAAPLAAQDKVPARPVLAAGADTNNAQVYYDLGVSLLLRDPKKSSEAFYWATRIAPNRADALYGRRSALLMADRPRFERYMKGDRRTIEHPRTMQIDSLMVRALMIDPFLYRKFERDMFRQWIINLNSSGFAAYQPTPTEIDNAIQQWIVRGGAETKGWAAYSDGDYRTALEAYGRAMKNSRRKARLRTERARIFHMSGRMDSALVEFGLALTELREREGKETVFLYDSKAMIEHSVARAHEAAGNPGKAREAYGRALLEDLSFYPAHVGLALLAAQDSDSATVESEMELAVELQPSDPVVRLMYGSAMLSLGRIDAAAKQLEKAVELEPYFAAPYRVLAQVHERRGDKESAVRRYQDFLDRSSATDPAQHEARVRRDALAAGG